MEDPRRGKGAAVVSCRPAELNVRIFNLRSWVTRPLATRQVLVGSTRRTAIAESDLAVPLPRQLSSGRKRELILAAREPFGIMVVAPDE
jgi:hypothetical protein